jgi:hypothetical protein
MGRIATSSAVSNAEWATTAIHELLATANANSASDYANNANGHANLADNANINDADNGADDDSKRTRNIDARTTGESIGTTDGNDKEED